DFGLHIKDRAGTLVPIDDARLDELWQTAGELGLPVLIHVGDPAAFFRPLDAENERVVELLRHPDWHFYPGFPSLEEIIDQLERLVRRHAGTTFIGAHAGCYPENLGRVGAMMDAAPNWHVDIAARIPELGRQPRAARRLIEGHPDRVLFGTDQFGSNSLNPIYYRVLETEDEYFPYSPDDYPFGEGFWHVSGIGLGDDTLRAVYRDNARRILRLP
ncbi:MAG: amidohydrolase family protein, partial [Candidatus Dormibacteraeota bacterium]|nr:amidohydrolase family protein [Candidatus Dormibacteraeota bacterium]